MDRLFESERTPEDVLGRRYRIRLGGRQYVLPVLTIAENEEWQRSLDGEVQRYLDDQDATPGQLLEALAKVDVLGLLYSYDTSGVLPPREEIEREVYPDELLLAAREVRLLANPTADYTRALMLEEARAEALESVQMNRAQRRRMKHTSSSRRPTAGRTATSGAS